MKTIFEVFITSCPRFVFVIPILFCSLLLTYLSHLPSPHPPTFGLGFEDKIYHTIAYFGWGASFLLYLVIFKPSLSSARIILFTILATALFGVYDEIHQAFVPNRSSTVLDWVADTLGGIIACTLYKPLIFIASVWHNNHSQQAEIL
jgi:VanZ family protein